jgi:hypothetical protein
MTSGELGPSDPPWPDPLFIIGSPRSGTTYLTEVLNHHPDIFLTNETRIMTWVNRALNVVPSDPWILHLHRDRFLEHLAHDLPASIRSFYLSIGAPPHARWGDKHPHYADGTKDPQCLETIDRLFPTSQFINIVRNGFDVVASIVNRNWVGLSEAINVWTRHVVHATEFGNAIGADRVTHVRYEELVREGTGTVDDLMRFLNLSPSPAVVDFLEQQTQERTPFSKPTLDLDSAGGSLVGQGLDDESRQLVFSRAGSLLADWGYI